MMRETVTRTAALAALVCLAGCAPKEPAHGPPAEIGRYQIVAVPGTTQAILLDTVTGQTWHRVSTGPSDADDVTEWLPMDKTTLREWGALNHPEPRPAPVNPSE